MQAENKQLRISFSDEVMEELFRLASTREHGSVYTIIKKAVAQYVNNVNSNCEEKDEKTEVHTRER